MTDEPSRYVAPRISDARVERLWSGVSERLQKPAGHGWRWLALGGALTAAAATALWLTHVPAAPAPAFPQRLAALTAPSKATLHDGSQLDLSAGSVLDVQSDRPALVALSLSQGRLACDVPHRAGRSFRVTAGDVEVRVVGTAFSVSATAGAAPRVEVSVLRGAVEVRSARRPGIVARVAAGESWIQEAGLPAALREPKLPESVGSAAPPSDASPSPSAPTPVPVAPASASPSAPTARELFERAGESRRAGDAAGAARAYEELLRLHPGDGRASLSAFELGRLRMDRLGDAAGAISALERAVALNVGPSFREDALARLVTAYAAQGNAAACARARDRYLSSYPAGVHASAVSSRCGAR